MDEEGWTQSTGESGRGRVSIHVDDARRRVEVRVHGVITYEDIVDLLDQRRARDLMDHDILVDFGSATTDLFGPQARALADHRNRLYAGLSVGRTAVVAAQDALYGMLRMYQTLSEGGPQLYIARTREAAEAWLDLPAD